MKAVVILGMLGVCAISYSVPDRSLAATPASAVAGEARTTEALSDKARPEARLSAVETSGRIEAARRRDRQAKHASREATVASHYREVEVRLDGKLGIDDIRALPQAPEGLFQELRDPARVVVQLPTDVAARLAKQGVDVRTLREFVLVEPAPGRARKDSDRTPEGGCAGDYQYGSNGGMVWIPDCGDWVYSAISISGAAGQTVNCIDVHYEIYHTFRGDLNVDLNDDDFTYNHDLYGPDETDANEDLVRTVTGITTFNGELVDQLWALWVKDTVCLDEGWIESWWIKVYYGGGGGDSDLVVQSSGRTPATGVTPGGLVALSHIIENQGTGAAESSFWGTWFISEDMNVTTSDFEWGFLEVPCCLAPGETAGAAGDVPWPDVAPYNTPEQTYYIAVMADDLNQVSESNENNNWGVVWPVELAADHPACPGQGDCCQDNGTPGCDDTTCCEAICAANPSCCDVGWDLTCADLAEELCVDLCGGGGTCPGEGDCCSPNGTPGCQDTACCNTVCTIDSYCCSEQWDALCAILAEDNCSVLCPALEPDIYEPDDTPAAATDVSCGETQTHSIDINGDVDWFAVFLEASGTLTVETFNLGGANPDTVLELYDESCAMLAADDDGGSELWASRLAWTADYTGIHYVKARTYGGEVDHCDHQGGGPKSCLYDIDFSCGFCCDPPFQGGDRVRLLVDNPGEALNLPAGTCGTVLCCDSDDPELTIMASWDSWAQGHNNDSYCDTPPAPYPSSSGWWMACDQIVHDEACGSCTPPPPPADPTPPDEASQVPLDTTVCWNTPGQTAKVIYGADDRLDIYEVSDASLLAVADSTVAVVSSTILVDNGNGTYSLPASPSFIEAIEYSYGLPLCESEPFADQPIPAFCSGFLVADDLIATAGHCVTNSSECSATAFVFGFDMANATTPVLTYPASDVYFCDAIVARVEDPWGADWGVIRLDRPVIGHAPVPIRRTGTVPNGQSLVMIGHPVGLPTKVAGGASVRDNSPAEYFQANVDAYAGNSASAILNTATLEVEGVLVRGNTDFVNDGGCIASNRCPDTGCPTWEAATRVTEFAELVPPIEVPEYEVFFEDCDGMAMAITAATTDTCWTPPTLEPNTRYCWQVTARNSCGESAGPVWSFTTRCEVNLTEAFPNHEESLWRSENNFALLTFDGDIVAPGEGEVLVRELLEDGLFGPDLSSSFAFTVENDGGGHPRILRVQETTPVLSHRKWYAVSSHNWDNICDVEVHYVVQVGDASNDGRVLSHDVVVINEGIPCFSCPDDRRDINGDNRVLSVDVSVTNASIPSDTVPKPSGH